MNDLFIPLGGANEIGASCYYLQLDGHKIILDAGKRNNSEHQCPDFNYLISKGIIDSFQEIELVILSHAHYDHIGALPILYHLAPKAKYISTDITKKISNLQLVTFARGNSSSNSESINKAQVEISTQAISSITAMPVMKTQKHNGFDVTFFPAGHMSGAVMTLIETNKKKVLYTGDFCPASFFGLNPMNYSGNNPDVLITTATYGYRRKYINNYESLFDSIKCTLTKGKNVVLVNNNIGKFAELMYLINSSVDAVAYLSPEKTSVADAFESTGMHIYSPKVKDYIPTQHFSSPHIVISSSEYKYPNHEAIYADGFSAHASFNDICSLIRQQDAAVNYLVHTQPQHHGGIPDELFPKYNVIQCNNFEVFYI